MIKTTAQKIYLGLIFIFLYAPIVTLIVLSFNASKTQIGRASCRERV